LSGPQMKKYVHWEIGRAPVMSEVSAWRKCVWRSGDVEVRPDRMMNQSITREPLRKIIEIKLRVLSGV